MKNCTSNISKALIAVVLATAVPIVKAGTIGVDLGCNLVFANGLNQECVPTTGSTLSGISTNGTYAVGTVSTALSNNLALTNENQSFIESKARASYGNLGIASNAIIRNYSATPSNALPPARQLTTIASGSSKAYWNDLFTVTSNSLGTGTPVNVRITQVIDVASVFGTFLGGSYLSFGTNYSLLGNYCIQSRNGLGCSPTSGVLTLGRNEISYDVPLAVGFSDILYASLIQLTGIDSTNILGVSTAGVDALNSAHTYFTVLTPGAEVVWAGGQNLNLPKDTNVSSVPIPATFLLTSVLLPLAFRRVTK